MQPTIPYKLILSVVAFTLAGIAYVIQLLTYEAKQLKFTFFDWTIGSYTNIAAFLAILFAVAGIVLGFMYLWNGSKKE